MEYHKVAHWNCSFFIMYTNDLIDCIRNSHVLLYADDTVIYRSDVSNVRNYRNIQEDLNRLLKWCNKNALRIDKESRRVLRYITYFQQPWCHLHCNKCME